MSRNATRLLRGNRSRMVRWRLGGNQSRIVKWHLGNLTLFIRPSGDDDEDEEDDTESFPLCNPFLPMLSKNITAMQMAARDGLTGRCSVGGNQSRVVEWHVGNRTRFGRGRGKGKGKGKGKGRGRAGRGDDDSEEQPGGGVEAFLLASATE